MKRMLLGPESWQSSYCREEGIVYDRQPSEEWQCMSTGTGRMGVAVIASDPLILQINHEGAIDERGYHTHIARLMLHMDGCPMAQANAGGTFRMRLDLKTSRILITTPDTEITIFAGMESQIAAVQWCDLREHKLGGSLSISVPYVAHMDRTDDTLSMWHENGGDTVWHEINAASGLEDDRAFEDPLKNRKFGLSVRAENERMMANGWKIEPGEVHRFYICADAGREAFDAGTASAALSVAKWDVLMNGHLAWFRAFWERARFDCDDERMSSFVAAYDLYRYFTAVACGKNREFPTRFQMPILSARTDNSDAWTLMQISSVQTIQAYFGILRNGDWDALESFAEDYRRKGALYAAYTRALTGVEGMVIPYESNPWGTAHFHRRNPDSALKISGEYHLYYIPRHKYSLYSYEHGLAILCFLWDAARARGDEERFLEWGAEQLEQMLLFFANRYMQDDGHMIFDPATSGETWYNCMNPASWIALFRVRLPQVRDMAERRGKERLRQLAEAIYNGLPELPRGVWRMEGETSEILPCEPGEEVVLPAERFDRHAPINRENPELYAIWPYGLYGLGREGYELALRSFRGRYWVRLNTGWQLDGIWAACLGLREEACQLACEQIENTIRCPGGFSFEEASMDPLVPTLPYYPSMQGMGNTVCALYEMLCHDNGDELIVLPAWPKDIPVSAVMYTASGGRTEICHRADGSTVCHTEKEIPIRYASGGLGDGLNESV